jgi:hypothetical protein
MNIRRIQKTTITITTPTNRTINSVEGAMTRYSLAYNVRMSSTRHTVKSDRRVL